jgi:hypothetical protein
MENSFFTAALVGMAAIGSVVLVRLGLWLSHRASRSASVERLPAAGRRGRLAGPISRHRCRARLLFCTGDELGLVLDAVVEHCDDATVPVGMPFSLRVATPPGAGRWAAVRLELCAEHEQSVLMELHDSTAGPKARLLAGDLALVLPLEEASGWPTFDPPAPSAYETS